jgi:hypothetical protein
MDNLLTLAVLELILASLSSESQVLNPKSMYVSEIRMLLALLKSVSLNSQIK